RDVRRTRNIQYLHSASLDHEPNELHGVTLIQLPLTGPLWPTILQWPRTASSGRRLTRVTFGAS
ncbi:MAG TPA: hypothetical protein VN727_15255, partial [Candidatus Binatia bacterium]|nr:hypothetical protein [Candidatus Binatia bacterium]